MTQKARSGSEGLPSRSALAPTTKGQSSPPCHLLSLAHPTRSTLLSWVATGLRARVLKNGTFVLC